jgi:16S rRNA (cytosine967-C5)-methyltransferase
VAAVAPARAVAAQLLKEIRRRDAYARDLMRESSAFEALDARDQALCMRIVLGVVATRGLVDGIIDERAKNPKKIEPRVRDVLEMGVFELLYLDTPARAVVHQAAALARSVFPAAAGFVNALLRQVAEADAPAVKAAVEAVCAGAVDAEKLAICAGTPEWLETLLLAQYGPEISAAVALDALEPAPIYVACDTFAHDPDTWLLELEEVGFRPEKTWLPGCVKLGHTAGFASSALAKTSIVSDLAAQAVAAIAIPGDGKRLLEVGQGRGTKSAAMLSRAHAAGLSFELDGVDVAPHKVDIARKRLAATGEKTRSFVGDGCDLAAIDGLYDAYDVVLLDAPCSGTGTLRRHPEITWSLDMEALDAEKPGSLAALQRRLLASAATKVAPGGRLVYATCSMLALEDRLQVEAFLASEAGRGFEVESVVEAPYAKTLHSAESLEFRRYVAPDGMFATVPIAHGPDGHFACSLVRVS